MQNMLKTQTMRQRLDKGESLCGPFLKIPASVPVELAAYAGFDFAIIDLEHSPFTFERAEELVRIARMSGIASVIRTYDDQPATIVRALDTGCEGLLVPNLQDKAETEAVVRSARFHPLGQRGMDPYARSAQYGVTPKDVYFRQANKRTLLAVQVEGTAAIQNLDGILDVEGTDLVFVGPYDLSQSLGLPGQIADPLVSEKVREIVAAAKERGKAVGIYADTVNDARRWRDLGIQFVAVSVDVRIFLDACQAMVDELKS